jgi:hypothetical protein
MIAGQVAMAPPLRAGRSVWSSDRSWIDHLCARRCTLHARDRIQPLGEVPEEEEGGLVGPVQILEDAELPSDLTHPHVVLADAAREAALLVSVWRNARSGVSRLRRRASVR